VDDLEVCPRCGTRFNGELGWIKLRVLFHPEEDPR
jgi:hypothetical protein